MTDPTIKTALAATAHCEVAGMLGYLAKWIRPELWVEWVEEYGLLGLVESGSLPYETDAEGGRQYGPAIHDVLNSALRLTYAQLN
jgi:hypothetical protein